MSETTNENVPTAAPAPVAVAAPVAPASTGTSSAPHGPSSHSSGPRGAGAPRGRREGGFRFRRPHRKVCRFCADKVDFIDYKDSPRLRSFISERGKILPSRMTGTCARHQRELTHALKRARNIALLPFANA
jgi:small subunit ribosomal protein S18